MISYTKTQLIGWRVRGFLKLSFMSYQILSIILQVKEVILTIKRVFVLSFLPEFLTRSPAFDRKQIAQQLLLHS